MQGQGISSGGRGPATRLNRPGRDRPAAVTIALLVHVGLFVPILVPQGRDMAAASSGDDAPAISVTLIRSAGTAARAAAEPPTEAADEVAQLEGLRQRLAAGALPAPAEPPKASVARGAVLLKAFASVVPGPDADRARSPPPSQDQHRAEPSLARPSPFADPLAQASVPMAASRRSANADIWPQVARCWSPTGSGPRVTLSVVLDGRGQLLYPPSVLGDRALKPDPERQLAEAEATRAVLACAPYTSAPAGQRSFELEFVRN